MPAATPPCTPAPPAGRRRGFALVITLSITALLVILVTGLLLTIRSQTGGIGARQASARADSNAIVSLRLSLGDLQRFMGPDQRVTASAALYDQNPQSPPSEGVGNPSWEAVYASVEDPLRSGSGSAPMIRASGADTLADSRAQPSFSNRDSRRMLWLISGGRGNAADYRTDPNTAIAGGSHVRLFSREQNADLSQRSPVSAPLIDLAPPTAAGLQQRAAYWVRSNANSVSLALPVDPAPNAIDQVERLQAPSQFGFAGMGSLDSLNSVTDPNLWKRVVTPASAALLASNSGTAATDIARVYASSLVGDSWGVLSNTLEGGLKRDLSVLVETGQAAADGGLPAVGNTTPLVSLANRDQQGPKYGDLLDWAKLQAPMNPDGSASPMAIVTPPNSSQVGIPSPAPRYAYSNFPEMTKPGNPGLHPVVTHAILNYRVSAYVDGTQYRFVILFYPRVTLFNPYNVPLAANRYAVHFNYCFIDDFFVRKSNSTGGDLWDIWWNPSGNPTDRPSFVLEPTVLQPGEALTFTAAPSSPSLGGLAQLLNVDSSDISRNVLSSSPNWAEPNGHCYYLPARGYQTYPITTHTPAEFANGLVYADHAAGGNYWTTFWDNSLAEGLKVSFHLLPASGSVNHTDLLSTRCPVLQHFDFDHYDRGNGGRWRAPGHETVYLITDPAHAAYPPYDRSQFGYRMRWLFETNPANGAPAQTNMQLPVLAWFNPRAARTWHFGRDSITGKGGTNGSPEHHFYDFGAFVEDDGRSPGYTAQDYLGKPASASTRRAPVFFSGTHTTREHRYPLYDVPRQGTQLLSLAAFRHARLSRGNWAPAYQVASSGVPSWMGQNELARTSQIDEDNQQSQTATRRPVWVAQDDGSDNLVFDVTYESNQALFDRHFLSGASSSEKQQFAADASAQPLRNPRLGGYQLSAPNAPGDLAAFYRAASRLMIRGAFDVNSTDVNAWRALLASTQDFVVPGTANGITTPGRYPYPRGFSNDGGPWSATGGASTAPISWTGYRRLNDDEINLLAQSIVTQVKLRGPFLSLSDFINRRLVPPAGAPDPLMPLLGTLDAAITRAGLNSAFLDNVAPNSFTPTAYDGADPTSLTLGIPGHYPTTSGTGTALAWGAAAYLLQGDLLQALAPVLTARSDTFTVRFYGEAGGAARWGEAVIQRLPDPVDPSPAAAWEPREQFDANARPFGRRCRILSIRYLNPNEV